MCVRWGWGEDKGDTHFSRPCWTPGESKSKFRGTLVLGRGCKYCPGYVNMYGGRGRGRGSTHRNENENPPLWRVSWRQWVWWRSPEPYDARGCGWCSPIHLLGKWVNGSWYGGCVKKLCKKVLRGCVDRLSDSMCWKVVWTTQPHLPTKITHPPTHSLTYSILCRVEKGNHVVDGQVVAFHALVYSVFVLGVKPNIWGRDRGWRYYGVDIIMG